MFQSIDVDSEIVLRPVAVSDASNLFDLVDRNRSYLREWLPWLDLNRIVADSTSFIERSIRLSDEGTGFVTLILYKEQAAGVIGYNWIDSLNRSCEIGYWIAQDMQNHGIVTRSTRALVEYAFDALNLNRINIPIAVKNTKSRSIPERLGFIEEGIKHEAEWLYDHFVDHVLYSMLRSGWTKTDDA